MKRHHSRQAGDHLPQESKALRCDLRPERRHCGQAVPRMRDALNQAIFHGVAARYENNRNSLGGFFAAMETVVANVTSRSTPPFSNSAAAILTASRSPPLSFTDRRIEPPVASVSSTC